MNVERELKRMGFKEDVIAKATVDGSPIRMADVPLANRDRSGICGSIPGRPIGKPRMTQRDKWKKRPCVVAYREWADLCRHVMGMVPDANRVEQINLFAYFEPPKSWPKKKRWAAVGTKHRVKPDLDNVAKAALDALFEEDSAIADCVVRKRWGWKPQLVIEIILVDE
jgi:Holliday junction resolvase RusA-like endonuclease